MRFYQSIKVEWDSIKVLKLNEMLSKLYEILAEVPDVARGI